MMKRLAVWCALLSLVLVGRVQAQTVAADRFRLNTGPCLVLSGSGSPEGVVTAGICSVYVNTATGVLYEKWSGSGNTGWGVGHNTNESVNGAIGVTGAVQNPSYVSQLTAWAITAAGGGDFRYLYTDELHAKAFIADLEQALAGGQIICKSVTSVAGAFTTPATGGVAALLVKDLPSAPNVQVFQSGDYVGVRTISRGSDTSLTIGDAYGVVTAYTDGSGATEGMQNWAFTRVSGADGGTLATSTVIPVDSIVIDYGTSGNGCHEVNAIDGANGINSPYNQTWTWTGASPRSVNRKIRTRLGNQTGIIGAAEYGLVAGDLTGSVSTDRVIIATDQGLRMYNADISLYDSGTPTVVLNHATPSLSIGATAPSSCASGTGIFMGKAGGSYVFCAGNASGDQMYWNGSALILKAAGNQLTSLDGNQITTNTINVGSINASGWAGNLIRNGNFEGSNSTVGFAGWAEGYPNSGAGFVSRPSTGGYVGPGGMQIAPGNGNQGSAAYLASPVVPGQTYRIAFWVLGGANTAGGLYLVVDESTSTSGTVRRVCNAGTSPACSAPDVSATSETLVLNSVAVTTSWTLKEASYTVPAGVNWASIAVHDASGTVTGTTYAVFAFDGFEFTQKIGAGSIVANSITAGQIAAGTITATQMSVGSLDAISANLGSITGGSITLGGGQVIVSTNGVTGHVYADSGSFADVDAGSITASSLKVTLGGGSGYVCIDGTGVFYRGASCP